jgi:MFS family permease
MGLYQALYAVGMFSGPFLAGWLNESWGLNGGFLFGSMLGAIAFALVVMWAMKERHAKMIIRKERAEEVTG